MIYKLMKEQLSSLWPLVKGWEETTIWSCLQGHMGRAWSNSPQSPDSARIQVGDFCFFAGAPNEELAASRECLNPTSILVPQNGPWAQCLLQTWGGAVRQGVRYAIRKEPGVFDRAHLQALANSLPEGAVLRPMDKALYEQALSMDWSRDLCSQFLSAEDYVNRGLGMAACWEGRLVSGASSYTVYDGGIEIEIVTDPGFRNRGLASACGAALICRCLEQGIYPSWDACDLRSVHLAEKLGYHMSAPYPVFFITSYTNANQA